MAFPATKRGKRRYRGTGDEGFTLIEVLVVVLVISILAGVALATFLSQKSKGYVASAKSVAVSAQTAAEAIATDNGGRYGEGARSFVSAGEIHAYEPSIPIAAKEARGGAWLAEAKAVEEGKGYELTVVTDGTTTESYTIHRLASGAVERTCSPVNKALGCTGSW